MVKISPISIDKIEKVSKKLTVPALSGLFTTSLCLSKSLENDVFAKEENQDYKGDDLEPKNELTPQEKRIYEKIKPHIPDNFEISDLKEFISLVKKDKKRVIKLMNIQADEGCNYTQKGISEVLSLKKKEKRLLLNQGLKYGSFVDEKTMIDAVKNVKTGKEKKFFKRLISLYYKDSLNFDSEILKQILQSFNCDYKKELMANYCDKHIKNLTTGNSLKEVFALILKNCKDKDSANTIGKLISKGEHYLRINRIISIYNNSDIGKNFIDSLLDLKKIVYEDGDIISSFKTKKEVPLLQTYDISIIVEYFIKHCPDKELALKLVKLEKKNIKAKTPEHVSIWENDRQLISIIENLKVQELRKLVLENIEQNPENLLKISQLCVKNLNDEAVRKYNYLKKIGVKNSESYIHSLVNSEIPEEESFVKKIQILKTLINDLSNERVIKAAVNKFSAEKWQEILETCKSQNASKEEILEILLNLKNTDIGLWKKIYTNPFMKGVTTYHIANEISKHNEKFILKLCAKENFPKNIISGIALRSKYSYVGYLKAICEDDSIDKSRILEYYDQMMAFPRISLQKMDMQEAFNMLKILNTYDENIKKICRKFGLDIDALIADINNLIAGVKSCIEIDKQQIGEFFSNVVANNSEVENFLKTYNFSQFGKKGLPLKYSRQDFNDNVHKLLNRLDANERKIICNHFGLKEGALNGYDGLYNNRKYSSFNISLEAKEVAEKIRDEINKFTTQNEVLIEDKKAKKVFDSLVRGLPNFVTTVGKQQHKTHDFSVDIHSLKVLQSALNNPLYKELDDIDKTVLKLSILLHDIGKREGIVDKGHAKISAEYVRAILENISLSEAIKQRIQVIVDSHHWFEIYCRNYAKTQDEVKNTSLGDFLINISSPSDLKIFEIFAKADFENVSSDFHFINSGVSTSEKFDKYINERMEYLEKVASEKIFSKSNFLRASKFSTNLFPSKVVKIDGKKETLKVLNFNEISDKQDMRKYGFGCSDKKDVRFLVHMTRSDRASFESLKNIIQNPLARKLWSMSFVKPDHKIIYENREYGGVFDVDSSDILMSFYENIVSGVRKTEKDFEEMITKGTSLYNILLKHREFLKKVFIEKMKDNGISLTDDDYTKISRHILDCKTVNSLKDFKLNGKIIKAQTINKCIDEAQEALFTNKQNEIVGKKLRLKALYSTASKIEHCSQDFLRYAKENDLAIILMPA